MHISIIIIQRVLLNSGFKILCFSVCQLIVKILNSTVTNVDRLTHTLTSYVMLNIVLGSTNPCASLNGSYSMQY